MANRYARKAGNWNATDVWSDTAAGEAGEAYIPTTGDVAYSNSFAIAANVNATCSEVRNDSSNGATQGGGFTLADGVTLTADAICGGANATYCVTFAANAPATATLAGNATATTGGSAHGARNTGTGTLTITGTVTGGTGTTNYGAQNNGAGHLIISGNAVGSKNAGAQNVSSGTITIAGDAIGGNTDADGWGVNIAGTGNVTVTGAVRCGTLASGIGGLGTGIAVVTGPLYRKATADGGDPYTQPIRCARWAFASASTSQYEVGLHSSGTLVTFEATEAPVFVDADLLARLQAVATVATTGAQIAALGPVA